MRIRFFPVSLCCLFFLTTACAPVAKDRFFWPLPPEQPRIEFIGVYNNESHMLTGNFDSMSYAFTGGSGKSLRQPIAVAADGHGKVYVSESVKNTVKVLDFVKRTIDDYNSTGFKLPFGLDIDRKGNLYVVERGGGFVSVFNPERAPLLTFGAGELGEPIRIAIDDERGRIYVSDRKDHQIKVFNLEGKLIQSIGGAKGVRSSEPGEFNGPNDLEIDRAGNLYVCDQLNARIQVFDPAGAFVRTFGVRGDQIHNFEGPMGIALDTFGNLWIADIRKSSLITYTSDTPQQLLMLTHGPAPTEGRYSFKSPMDIFIDQNNRIYVADGLAQRLSVWQILDDPYLAQHPVPENWLQRTDIVELWYRDSNLTPPKKDPTAEKKP